MLLESLLAQGKVIHYLCQDETRTGLIFTSLQALRERVQELFDQLTLEQVMSVSSYNFILEALFYATSQRIGITIESIPLVSPETMESHCH